MINALLFIFLLIVVFLFACVIVLMFQNFQPVYIVDLAEFRDLDPVIKHMYKRYLVDIVLAALIKRVNEAFKDMKHGVLDREHDIKREAYKTAREIRALNNNAITKFIEDLLWGTTQSIPAAEAEDQEVDEGYDDPRLGNVFQSFVDAVRKISDARPWKRPSP